MPETENLAPVLEQLEQMINKASIPLSDRLWSIDDIADYVQLSKYTAAQRVVTQPGFPAPVGLLSKRWLAGEVIAWMKKSKGRTPKGRRLKNVT